MKVPYSAFLSSLYGRWAIQPEHREVIRALIESGTQAATKAPASAGPAPGGVAVIPIVGPVVKYDGPWGVSSLATAATVAQAAADPNIKSILLFMDTPGGMVAGTAELADAVAAAAAVKPVIAQVSDLTASAGVWIASQASKVYANEGALYGSIGVYTTVEDYTGMMDKMGIKVHLVSTGPYKGAGEPGTPITKDMIDQVQTIVDSAHEQFLGAIQTGRKMDIRNVRKLSDGRIFTAKEAAASGLIDKVQGMDQTVAQMMGRASRAQRAAVSIRLAELRLRYRGEVA